MAGKAIDANAIAKLDDKKFADAAKKIFEESVAIASQPEGNPYIYEMFKPKGEMKLNQDGGIEIYVAAQKPEKVPEENWLPINRKDEALDIVMRIYAPDMKKLRTWNTPKAEKL